MKSQYTKYIQVVVGVISIFGMASGSYAQTTTVESFASTVAKFKGEKVALQRGEVTIEQQQRFVQAAIQVFIQRAIQIKEIVETDELVLEENAKTVLLDRIRGNIKTLESYYGEAGTAYTTEELRVIVGKVMAQRATVGQEIRRAMLEFYIAYFQKTAQQKVIVRYQNIQAGLLNAKNAGKDTSGAEKVLYPAATLVEQIDTTIKQVQATLTDTEKDISLDTIEVALQKVQKNITTLYDIFRKITIQGGMMMELNKEEKGIQNTLPTESL